jgi:probable DNA metabolism protein
MITIKYDGTFEGLLTLIFECYEQKLEPLSIIRENAGNASLFNYEYLVNTDEAKAKRVWNGLHRRISAVTCQMLYYTFLSEEKNVEMLILNYVRKVFASSINIEANFGDADVLEMKKIAKKVNKEAGRVPMFVRFQKTADDIYYASYDPQYNVLPLVTKHFEERFADQRWIIYDTRRNFGFYYDLKTTSEIRFVESKINTADGSFAEEFMAAEEKIFQELWKNYFSAICIRERLNPKLHVQLLPRRYWKYLIEKQA